MTDPSLLPADVVRTVPEGEVVYGMQLPIQSQSTLYVAEWEKEAGPSELARIARVADEAGFFYLGVCDHTAIPRRLAEAMGTIWYDTTATLHAGSGAGALDCRSFIRICISSTRSARSMRNPKRSNSTARS